MTSATDYPKPTLQSDAGSGIGSKSWDVWALQNWLIYEGYLAQGDNTGNYGPLTKAAVTQLQTNLINLGYLAQGNNTGYYGPLTEAALQHYLGPSTLYSHYNSSSLLPGFDIDVYPGDTVMSALHSQTNLQWAGYYLDASSHNKDVSWMGTRSYLQDTLGWKLAPIYVGAQDPTVPGNQTFVTSPISQADADAGQALAEMGMPISALTNMGLSPNGETTVPWQYKPGDAKFVQNFAIGTTVFLDWETGTVTANDLSYITEWVTKVAHSGYYKPGIYVPSSAIGGLTSALNNLTDNNGHPIQVQFWGADWGPGSGDNPSQTLQQVTINSSTSVLFAPGDLTVQGTQLAALQIGSPYGIHNANLSADLISGVDLDLAQSSLFTANPSDDTVSETAPTSTTASAGVSTTISGVQVVDDGLNGETFSTVIFDNAGTLSASGTSVSGSGTHSLSITGTLSQVNAALNTLTYSNSSAGADTITVTTSDLIDHSSVSKNIGVTINGGPNQPPAVAPVVASKSITVGTDVSWSQLFTVSDQESDTIVLYSVDESNTSGVGSWYIGATPLTGQTFVNPSDLANLHYHATVAGIETIYFQAREQENGTTQWSNQASVNITVIASDDSVSMTAPSSITPQSGVNTAISGLQIVDDGLNGETFTVHLNDSFGNLSASGAGVSGSGTSSLTITGTLSQVNNALGTLNYVTAVSAGSGESIFITTTDSDGSTTSKIIGVTVIASDDTVRETVPSSITAAAGQTFAFAGASAVQVNDDGLNGETFSTVIFDNAGTLSASGTGVSGSGTHSLSITGTLSQVNAALNTLTYSNSSAGADTITVTTSDLADQSSVSKNIAVTVNPVTVIESLGPTSLVQIGNNYFLYAHGTTNGPELKYGGAAFVAGSTWGAWSPIGVEAISGGYEVAFKAGADSYTVWNTDTNGNITTNALATTSGSSAALEALETSFQQDLNGDTIIGPPSAPPVTIIESLGSTSLAQAGNNFFLYAHGTTNGPELKYGGAAFVAGSTWGAWAPIGVEAISGGYEVAFKAGADSYTVWNTDTNGNITTNALATTSGSSAALEALETSFQQDLNGDTIIGPPSAPPVTIIESLGSTSLAQAGNNFFLYAHGTTNGPELKYGGAAFVAGSTWGAYAPIGVEAISGGYEVAFKAGADSYTVWNADANGNLASIALGTTSGSSAALEALETSFQQDLNGDHTIGVPGGSGSTTIEFLGSTSLIQTGNNFFLYAHGTANGPELKYGGAAFTAGSTWGAWAPIGTEAISGGYEVAFKIGTDTYTVWNTDTNGNLATIALGTTSGGSSALQSIETSFQQDLNNDGVIGVPSHTAPAATTAAITAPSSGNAILSGSAAADTFVFNAHLGGNNTVGGFQPGVDQINLDHTLFASVSDLFTHTTDNVGGSAVVTIAADQSIAFDSVSKLLLQQHASDFHLV
jgi:20S proteasome alpha/beta subunit